MDTEPSKVSGSTGTYTVVITVAGCITKSIADELRDSLVRKLRHACPASLTVNGAVTDDPVTA